MRRVLTISVAAVSLLSLVSCGSSGRELRDPPTGMTAPAPTTTTVQTSTLPSGTFSVSSPTIAFGGEIPTTYTCRGDDKSPPIQWASVPAGTVELALVVASPGETDTTFRWVVTGLDPAVDHLDEGASPPGTEQANSFGRAGWTGPCPKVGEVDDIEISLYALTQPLTISPGATTAQIVTALGAGSARRAVMTATSTGS